MKEIIKVGMADLEVTTSPHVLVTLGLGSCLGIILYDSVSKIGGLAHVMLPDIEATKIQHNKAKFANSAIREMIEQMIKLGAQKKNFKAKLIGGAHMFTGIKLSSNNAISAFNVGDRNILSAKEELTKQNIELIGEDVGRDYGRSVEFDLETGKVKIKTITWGMKEL